MMITMKGIVFDKFINSIFDTQNRHFSGNFFAFIVHNIMPDSLFECKTVPESKLWRFQLNLFLLFQKRVYLCDLKFDREKICSDEKNISTIS